MTEQLRRQNTPDQVWQRLLEAGHLTGTSAPLPEQRRGASVTRENGIDIGVGDAFGQAAEKR